jgi:hypothetical protein
MSTTVGVGHIFTAAFSGRLLRWNWLGPPSFDASWQVGVGHDEDPVTSVRGADGCRRYAVPLSVIPARGQVCEYLSHSSRKESWDVLHHDEPGS